MINAHKEKIQSFFQGTLQYEIPFFQRAYVWDEENWSIFWEHLNSELEAYQNGEESEHFIGTIITKQKESKQLGENVVELIDGQQRLTTISLFFKALADTAKGDLPNLKNSINSFLMFEDSYNNVHYRMLHSRIDRPNYEMVLEKPDELDGNYENNIISAYRYFYNKLRDFDDQKRNLLQQVLLHKIPAISMLLDPNDDEQEIFDTINSLGVKLTIGELLKNYIFKEKELQTYYDYYWFDIFEGDEEQVKYWSTERTSGRIKRDNMEVLLYCFLIIETKKEIRLDRLFKEYKTYLKDKSTEDKIAFLQRLNQMAEVYSKWPQEKELVEISFNQKEKRFFHVIENLEITTIYPLILFLYQNITNSDERLRTFEVLETYIALRQICKLTTKNYNNLFLQIMRQLEKAESINASVLSTILQGFEKDTNRLPDRDEVRNAFKEVHLSNKQAGEILYIIALKDIYSEYSDNKTLSSKAFSIEHIMPKKWKKNWNSNNLNELEEHKRNQIIKTLGNLTLITKNLNSKLKNQAWQNKIETLKKYSSLKITTNYLDKSNWDEQTIMERADNLANKALEIWKL